MRSESNSKSEREMENEELKEYHQIVEDQAAESEQDESNEEG